MAQTSDDEMEIEFQPQDVVEEEEEEKPFIKIEFDEPEEIIVNVSPEAFIMGENLDGESVNGFRAYRNKNDTGIEMLQRRILRSSSGASIMNYEMDDSETDEDEKMVYNEERIRRRASIPLTRFSIIPSKFAPPKNFATKNVADGKVKKLNEDKHAPESITATTIKQSRAEYSSPRNLTKEKNTSEHQKNVKIKANATETQKLAASKESELREKRRLYQAEMYKKRKANVTPEQRTKQLAAVAERRRLLKEAAEQSEKQLLKKPELNKKGKANKISEECSKRLAAEAESQRLTTVEEERAKERLRNAKNYRKRKANEKPEEREKRLLKKSELYWNRRANETPEQRTERLAAKAERQKGAKAEEKREKLRLRMAKNYMKRKANERPEEREKRLEAAAERYRKNAAKKLAQLVERKPSDCEADVQEETPEERNQCLTSAGKRTKQLHPERKILLEQRKNRLAAWIKKMESKTVNEMAKLSEEQHLATEMTRNEEASGKGKQRENSLVSVIETNKDVSETVQQCLAAGTEIMKQIIAKMKGMPERSENSVVPEMHNETSETVKQQRLSAAGKIMKQRLAKRKGTPKQDEKEQLITLAKRIAKVTDK